MTLLQGQRGGIVRQQCADGHFKRLSHEQERREACLIAGLNPLHAGEAQSCAVRQLLLCVVAVLSPQLNAVTVHAASVGDPVGQWGLGWHSTNAEAKLIISPQLLRGIS